MKIFPILYKLYKPGPSTKQFFPKLPKKSKILKNDPFLPTSTFNYLKLYATFK